MNDMRSRLSVAIERWEEALGRDSVLTNPADLRMWETATYNTSERVFAVISPVNSGQVAGCVSIANEYGIPIYPVSRGRNWGLGSRVPVQDSVVLDLSRLDRVIASDERFGCITLEPGVTFQQVHRYLSEQNSAWFLPVIGGPADASVIGNCVERGDRIGPQRDQLSDLCSLEVVLPNGSVVHTGFGRFGETPLTSLSSMPAGPYLDGLFTQSNFGIVTRATLWLVRHPKCLQVVSARIPDGGLAAFVDSLQPLVESLGKGFSTFTLWNGHKLNARQGPSFGPRFLLGDHSSETWFCQGCLYAPSALMAAAHQELTVQALQASSQELNVFDEVAVPDLRRQAGLFLGVPNNDNVRSLYSRKRGPLPECDLDPDRDRCGAIWLCPEIPFDGATVAKMIASGESILRVFGYDPVIGMSASTSRTIRVFISIIYDREAPGEDSRAMRCHNQLEAELFSAGMFPFRLGIHSMHVANQATGPCWDLIRQIKDSIDPTGILAPGRYCYSFPPK
jgi:4-cresol dehydrogenase (hydroxylating)